MSPPTHTVPRLCRNATSLEVTRAVHASGCAVIEDLVPAATMQAVADELDAALNRVPYCEGSFTGRRTKRVARLVARSATCRGLLMHELVLESVGALLAGECYDFQVHATSAVRIDPGEHAQSLHRDDGVYPFRHPTRPCHINTIWAVDDFTASNGATRVVPGSHAFDDTTKPAASSAQPVEMRRGSVLVFDAALYHGGGANVSNASRTAVILGYTLGWLRQEENQYLAVPPKLAATLPRRLQRLLGYTTHGFLGSFEGQDPAVALAPDIPDVLPFRDLYGPRARSARDPATLIPKAKAQLGLGRTRECLANAALPRPSWSHPTCSRTSRSGWVPWSPRSVAPSLLAFLESG